MFSLVPRCQGLCGSQKYTFNPVSMVMPGMLTHLRALIPSERAAKLLRQRLHCLRDRIADCLGAVSRHWRSVLFAVLVAMPWQARQMQQHREPRLTFDQCSNRGARQPKNEVAFPVAGYGAIFNGRRPLADENLRRYESLATTTRSLSGHAQCSPRTQAGGELTSKGTTPLDVQRLVDRFVTDAHRIIIGEVDGQTMSNLLRTPRPRPSSVLPWSMAPPVPRYLGASDRLPGRGDDLAGQPVLDIAA